jgi:hypothetical protein
MTISIPLVTQFNDKGLRQATRDIDKFSTKAKKQFDGLAATGRKLAIGLAGAAVATVAIGRTLIQAGETASTSNARINQIAQSMGLFGDATAAVSQRLIEYAETTARATGVDQNSIKATQAKLLTFSELGKTAIEVGGAFDRATAAAIDLAAAGFGEAESNAAQLGKALQDPIKGLTALTRSGVTFNATEQQMIKTLVESGRVGEAQAVILSAIETQVGGTAKATANASDQMRVAFSQLAERLGTKLLPIFVRFAGFIADRLFPAVDRFARIAFGRLVEAFNSARPVLNRIVAIFNDYLLPVIERVIRFMKDNEDVVKAFFLVIGGAAALALIAAAVAALSALVTPIGLIVAAIAVLAGAFVYLYQNNETFRNNMDAIGRFFRDKFPGYFLTAFELIRGYFKFYYDIYAAIARTFNRTFGDETTLWSKTTTNVFTKMFDGLKTIVQTRFDNIRLQFEGFSLITGGIWKLFTSVITASWQGMFAALQQIATGGFQLLKASFLLLTLPIRFIWSLFSDEIKVIWQFMWGAITRATSTAFNLIRDTFNNIRNTILGVLGGVFGSVVSIVQNIIEQVARAVAAISSIPSAIPGVGIARGIAGIVGGIVGRVREFADGGLVTGPTLGLIGEAGPEMVIPLDKMGGMGTTVVVNVAGSVISERDLIETIRVGLVRSQRSGRSLSN